MAKETFGPTQTYATKTLFAVMQERKRRGGSMPFIDLSPFVDASVEFCEWEKALFGGEGVCGGV